MKKLSALLLACIFCLGACLNASNAQPGSEAVQAAISPGQQSILNRVNKERQSNGLGNVHWDSQLAGIAEQRAREISGRFSHTRPDGSSWMTLLDGYGSPWTNCGENIARAQDDPEAVMDAWMLSSGHRTNILKPAFTRLGVGVYRSSDGKLYWVQIFAGQ